MWHAWKRSAYRVLVRKRKRKDHLGHTGVDVRVIIKWILKAVRVVESINLAQDSDRWQAVVYTVMNLRAS
jgi:hypothetical protein